MNHRDHVQLISNAIPRKAHSSWADFGSGDGAFTLALRDIGGEGIEIYSIDQDEDRLARQEEAFAGLFPQSTIHFLHQDFTKTLTIPALDGIIMANSLHYVEDKVPFLRNIQRYLKPNGKFILVEYNVDRGNIWVPYPISFHTFEALCPKVEFSQPTFLHSVPSHFLHEIYACATTIE